MRALLWLCAIAVLVWASVDSGFRDAEGHFRSTFCLPITVAIAFMVFGWGVTGKFREFAFWIALVLVGQAAALQMIDAGPLIRYQHYKPLPALVESHPFLVLYLVFQTALVVGGFRTRWAYIRSWLGCRYKAWQLGGVVVVFVLSSAAVSRDVSSYISEILFACLVQAVNLGNIVLMAWSLPQDALAGLKHRLGGLFGETRVENRGVRFQDVKSPLGPSAIRRIGFVEETNSCPERGRRIGNLKSKIKGSVDGLTLLAAVWVTALGAVLSYFVYEAHPHVQDEVIYLYHARYFAQGLLTAPAPPVPEAFALYMLPIESDRWFSIFPPGWPAVLTVGVLFGVPWLINPILLGVNLVLASLLIREIYDHRTALIVVLLLCCSPWFIFMGMNLMSHTFTLTCALIATLAIARAKKTSKVLWALLGGIGVGVVGLIRPLDGLVIAGLLGLWGIGLGGKRLKISTLTVFIVACVAVNAIALPYNRALTGDPWLSPLTAYYEKYHGADSNAFGFGPSRGLGWPIDPYPGHSPIEALINANLNLFSVNIELFGWSTGSLILVLLLLFSRKRRSDYFMLATTGCIVGAYSLYWFSGGPDFGARYWFLTVVPLTALTARGVQFLADGLDIEAPSQDARPALEWFMKLQTMRVIAAITTLCFLALVNYFPWRAIDKYHHYLDMRPDIRHLARYYNFGKSLVLIRGKSHPDYASAWAYNALDYNEVAPVYAWDRSPEVRARVIKAFPERSIWLVDGPTITQAGFKVVSGPLSSTEFMAQARKLH